MNLYKLWRNGLCSAQKSNTTPLLSSVTFYSWKFAFIQLVEIHLLILWRDGLIGSFSIQRLWFLINCPVAMNADQPKTERRPPKHDLDQHLAASQMTSYLNGNVHSCIPFLRFGLDRTKTKSSTFSVLPRKTALDLCLNSSINPHLCFPDIPANETVSLINYYITYLKCNMGGEIGSQAGVCCHRSRLTHHCWTQLPAVAKTVNQTKLNALCLVYQILNKKYYFYMLLNLD